MWISKAAIALRETDQLLIEKLRAGFANIVGENTVLRAQVARLGSDLDWFKHRLNQVERERGQLIQAAIGIKISVPEFVPTFEDPAAALQQMPDLSSIGNDAIDQGPVTDADVAEGVDYSLMPGYQGGR